MSASSDQGFVRPDAYSRRGLLMSASSLALGASVTGGSQAGRGGVSSGDGRESLAASPVAGFGPASKYVPIVEVAFVRRKGEYGMRWPGQIYDGRAALDQYLGQIEAEARRIGFQARVRPEPIHSLVEADAWIDQARGRKADGLLTVLLDRQEHTWPTAEKATESGIPTVIFAPIGAAFTVNTARLAAREGISICSTNDFAEVAFALRMLWAGAKLRETRFIVMEGEQRRDIAVPHVGTKLRYVPAKEFLDEYSRTPVTAQIERLAEEYMGRATRVSGPTREDVINGVKSYAVARAILEREEGDGITMDCLGALGHTPVSLPCIAWSRMLDLGIPAACEADIGAAVTHAIVQYLFRRPGFQQDPVPETATGCLIGAHCSCATRLSGFDQPPESFYLSHHHGKRDAVPRTMWRVGQRATVACYLSARSPETRPRMVISTGQVVDNIAVPPAGGCVVSVTLKLDGVKDTLAYPGFHQLFLYGDYGRELQAFCRLFRIQPQVV